MTASVLDQEAREKEIDSDREEFDFDTPCSEKNDRILV